MSKRMNELENEWCVLPLKVLGVACDMEYSWELFLSSWTEAFYDTSIFSD